MVVKLNFFDGPVMALQLNGSVRLPLRSGVPFLDFLDPILQTGFTNAFLNNRFDSVLFFSACSTEGSAVDVPSETIQVNANSYKKILVINKSKFTNK